VTLAAAAMSNGESFPANSKRHKSVPVVKPVPVTVMVVPPVMGPALGDRDVMVGGAANVYVRELDETSPSDSNISSVTVAEEPQFGMTHATLVVLMYPAGTCTAPLNRQVAEARR